MMIEQTIRTIRQMTAESWAEQINQQTAQTVDGIIATGRLLILAKAGLVHGEFLRLFSEHLINISERSARYLMAVARNAVLSNRQYLADLPLTATALYALSQISEETLRAAIADGRVSAALSPAQAAALRRACKAVAQAAAATPPPPERGKLDLSAAGKAARVIRVRDLAHDGYTSDQIAAELGLCAEHVMRLIKRHSIDYPAARSVQYSQRRIDSNVFVDRVATDVENMLAHLDLIDYPTLDGARLDEWIASLKAASSALTGLIRQLTHERDRYVATHEKPGGEIESQARADRPDACTGSAGGAAEI